jgi:ATP-dependent DNA helicase RecG
MILFEVWRFMMQTIRITDEEAKKVTQVSEGQFSDAKAKDISPSSLSKTLSAFANSDGGDLYIGIDEIRSNGMQYRQWRGFDDVEAANGHIQAFEQLFPLGQDCLYEFLRCEDHPGLILHLQVLKTKRIVKATNAMPYTRRGAQNLPVDNIAAQRQLELAKGLTTFETETVNAELEIITDSKPAREFIEEVVPKTNAAVWLKKQALIVHAKPTVAGVLLFAEEPQALLPKRCGIKVYRYKTTSKEGFRDVLAFTPITVEGWLYKQIRDAVAATTKEIEKIPKMGKESLEAISYPPEALHEIITNAVIHRDYSVADDVHIRIFDNRIEVENPGRLPAHITVKNILSERFARNGAIVRILNKFPDPPNKDVGEGLNTAFSAMHKIGLKEPSIQEKDNSVMVVLKHEPLASAEEAIMDYLGKHETINNKKAREITHISEDHRIRATFRRMEKQGMIERTSDSVTSNTKWKKKC